MAVQTLAQPRPGTIPLIHLISADFTACSEPTVSMEPWDGSPAAICLACVLAVKARRELAGVPA